MALSPRPRVLIVGGGLVGSLLACLMGEQGWDVELVERRGDPRSGPAVGGRSINLAISARGLKALRRAGLEQAVLSHAVRMPGRIIHDVAGKTQFQPYSASGTKAINSINRGVLNRLLVERAASFPSVRLVFNERCTAIDTHKPAATLHDVATGAIREVAPDLIIATDGAYSIVRDSIQKREQFQYSQSWLHAGYKELTMPPADSPGQFGQWRMDPNGLHIWPRGDSMMIALANAEGSFTCTLFWPHEGSASFGTCGDEASVRARLQRDYPDAIAQIPDAVEQFLQNPVGHMVTVKCSPWHVGGRVALAGDAAHAIVPFFGQGANCGFEDAESLVECLADGPDARGDWTAALERYHHSRKRHADAIADLAVANFHEMSHTTATAAYRVRKAVDHALARVLPGMWTPLYEMISFTTIPYDDARERARTQWWWFQFTLGIAVGLGGYAVIAALMTR